MYSAFWFWPFAPWGSKNVASWLQEQLNQEPDLLSASYTQLNLINVALFFVQWWCPLLILTLIGVCLVWIPCYYFNSKCRACTNRCAKASSDCTMRAYKATRTCCTRRFDPHITESETERLSG